MIIEIMNPTNLLIKLRYSLNASFNSICFKHTSPTQQLSKLHQESFNSSTEKGRSELKPSPKFVGLPDK